jgi:putative hydrolase of the HAD superfamily|tara:strand:+ start:13519 stop:14214 length:696 start_codon:yes stop_codon:yes gene_type:complete
VQFYGNVIELTIFNLIIFICSFEVNMLPTNIKNIILDLGGVIINLDTQKPFNSFKKLFADNYSEIETTFTTLNLFNNFEVGKVTAEEFILFFLNRHPNLTPEKVVAIWNSMLLDIPKERIVLIRKLALKYNVFLLSNTNEIHLIHINKYLFDTYGITSINSLFKKAYFSHEVGFRKPDTEIFKLVLTENKLNPSETLFIDDSIEHIQSTKQLGITTKHLVDESLNEFFNEY